VKAAIAVAVAFSVPLNPTQQLAIIALAGTLSTSLVAADALIRRARAQHLAGPAADLAAAQAIAGAKAVTTSGRISSEAELEQQAQAANDAAEQPPDGIDPATL
jgi:GH24 family phage-related lysozyme (muramidase)